MKTISTLLIVTFTALGSTSADSWSVDLYTGFTSLKLDAFDDAISPELNRALNLYDPLFGSETGSSSSYGGLSAPNAYSVGITKSFNSFILGSQVTLHESGDLAGFKQLSGSTVSVFSTGTYNSWAVNAFVSTPPFYKGNVSIAPLIGIEYFQLTGDLTTEAKDGSSNIGEVTSEVDFSGVAGFGGAALKYQLPWLAVGLKAQSFIGNAESFRIQISVGI